MLQSIRNFVVSVKYTLFSIVIAIVGAITVFIVFTSSIVFNPVQSNVNFAEEVLMYTPQGWAFFTRDAREEQVYIYKIDNRNLVKINQRHADFRNVFGLSRRVSQLGLEADIITNIIGKHNFTATTWNYNDNLLGVTPKRFIEIHNPIQSPVLCGEYLVVYHSVVPWAWSKSKTKIPMPAKVIKLKIKC